MGMKSLRACLAGAGMLLLCAGCFASSLSNITDRVGTSLYGRISVPSSTYGALIQVAPAPTSIADGGVADAELVVVE